MSGSILAQSPAAQETGRPFLRALILSGGGKHDWQKTTAFLRQLLNSTERFEVRVCETPVGLTAETLSPFDVVIDDYAGARLGNTAEKAIEAFVQSGKGFVVLHDRALSFAPANDVKKREEGKNNWPSFLAMTKSDNSRGNSNEPTPFSSWFPVKLTKPEHPITSGIKDGQKTVDRPCMDFIPDSKAEVLMTTETGQPLAFVSRFGEGRVFATALGANLAAMQEKLFITALLRGTEWAASGKVTLPEALAMPEPKAPEARILVVTGGHDHEASFYRLFEDDKFGWVPVSDSKTAFQQDIRGKYDVLVLYDFTRDLDDKGKQNLRDFVESGKGVVVLHHAVLNYQKWPWWFEEVVGGRYRLEHEDGIPNSTVKMGEEHWITPAGSHPITDGVGPFHVVDETYRGLWISPKIQPLLKTTNRTSDPVVGWIGPCTTSRVVYLQLGHDHSPFRHPAYQALVRNAILWSAGKL